MEKAMRLATTDDEARAELRACYSDSLMEQAVINLYQIRRARGDTVLEALEAVYRASLKTILADIEAEKHA